MNLDSICGYEDLKNSLGYDIIRFINKNADKDKLINIFVRLKQFAKYISKISESIYEKLDKEDQEVFLRWFLTTYSCHSSIDNSFFVDSQLEEEYNANKNIISKLPVETTKKYNIYGLSSIGYNIKLAVVSEMSKWWADQFINNCFLLEEYNKGDIKVEPKDVVFDCGAFVGDTALYFYDKTKGDCTVHCFELVSKQIEAIKTNITLNNINKDRIIVNRIALSDNNGDLVHITEGTAAAKISNSIESNSSTETSILTKTIDTYVQENNLSKIDFIKMDTEGAERHILSGAHNTIQTFKPKLAVCIYHFWDDVFVIPEIINNMCSDYKFAFKWTWPHTNGHEAVLFCKYAEGSSKQRNISRIATELEFISAFGAMLNSAATKIKQLNS